MAEHLTPDKLGELRRLYDASTKGEWRQVYRSSDELQTTFTGVLVGNEVFELGSTGWANNNANATLIAAMHNALPALLDMAGRVERPESALQEIALIADPAMYDEESHDCPLQDCGSLAKAALEETK